MSNILLRSAGCTIATYFARFSTLMDAYMMLFTEFAGLRAGSYYERWIKAWPFRVAKGWLGASAYHGKTGDNALMDFG